MTRIPVTIWEELELYFGNIGWHFIEYEGNDAELHWCEGVPYKVYKQSLKQESGK